MNPWLIRFPVPVLGHIAVSTYFCCLILGIVLASNVATREARRSRIEPLTALQVALVAIVCGLVGGRLGHVFFAKPAMYLEDPLRVLQFWRGGMVFYGSLLGGALGMAVACRRARLSIVRVADVFAAPVMLGLAFGRMGCLAAGCCYGRPIDWPLGIEWPWAVTYLSGQVPAVLRGVALHPTQAYSAFNALIIFVMLSLVRKTQRFDGEVAALLLVVYGLSRGILEFFRLDLARGFVLEEALGQVLSTSQALSIPLVIGGLVILIRGRRSRSPAST